MSATPQQVRQWSEEVAADPGSRAFLPLAEHYRAAGRRDAALRLVVRGLERHPYDVEAHHLLGLIYRDAGDLVRAEDEWATAVALAPEHLGARRELGLFYHSRGDWEQAVKHLDRARELDVMDDRVRLALEEAWAWARGETGDRGQGTGDSRPTAIEVQPPAASAESAEAPAAAPVSPAPPADAAATEVETPSPVPTPPSAGTVERASDEGGWQGGREFEVLAGEFHALAGERGIVGAVMLDAQGFVVAGELHVAGRDRGPEIAAVLSPASFEAERSLRHLGLGSWRGILVETGEHVVRLSPTADGGMVAVAGSREVPTGWVLRVAGRAREAAERFLAALGGEGR